MPVALAASVAAAFPLTAESAHPLILPAFAAVVLGGLLILARPELGIAAVLALAPFTNFVVAGQKPFQLILPALALAVLAYGLLVRNSDLSVGPLALPLAAFVAFAVIASMQGLDPSRSFSKLVVLMTAAALLVCVPHICRTPDELAKVVGGALVGTALAAAHGLGQLLLGLETSYRFAAGTDIIDRIHGSFGHPNSYGGFMALFIPVALGVAGCREFRSGLRTLALVTAVLATPALVFSYTRGAIAGLVVGSLLWLALVRPRLLAVVLPATAALALLLAPPTLRERFDPSQGRGDVPLRADIWSGAVAIYERNPLFGVGLDTFPRAYEALPSVLDDASQRRLLNDEELLTPTEAQNVYLNVLAETGTLGFAAFLALALAALATLQRATRLQDPRARALGLGLGAGFSGFLVHGILDVTLLTELAMPLFALLGSAAAFVSLERPAAAASRKAA